MKDTKKHLFNKLAKRNGVPTKYRKSFGTKEQWSKAIDKLKAR